MSLTVSYEIRDPTTMTLIGTVTRVQMHKSFVPQMLCPYHFSLILLETINIHKFIHNSQTVNIFQRLISFNVLLLHCSQAPQNWQFSHTLKKSSYELSFYFLYVLRTIDFVRDRLLGVNNGWVNVYSDQDRNLPHGSPTTLIKIQYRTHYKIQKE